MEVRFQKRLFKPTTINETSIQTELQICKHIISSQIKKKLHPTIKQRKKLHDRLLQLEWDYTKLDSYHDKLKRIKQAAQLQGSKKPEIQKQIEDLQKNIVILFTNCQNLQKKIHDREQLMASNNEYLQRLRKQQIFLEKCMEDTKTNNQNIQQRIEKLDFIIRQTLQKQSAKCLTFQRITQQKLDIKLKLSQKLSQLRNKLKSIQQRINKQQKKLKSKQQQNQQISDRIYNIQADQQLILYKLTIQAKQTKKLQYSIKDQKNRNMELTQKLKILKQRQQKLKRKNSRLGQCKQNVVKAITKLHESSLTSFQETRKFEQTLLFDIQHNRQLFQAQ